MKFGKQLEDAALPKFRGYYIQYKELKKAIKVFTGQERTQATVQEVTHWTSSFLRLGPNPEVPPEAKLNDVLMAELDRVSKFTELQEDALKSQLDRLDEDSRRKDADHAALVSRVDDLGDQILHLKGFSQLNFTGFRKILKKYDKWSNSAAMLWFMGKVARAPLMRVDYGGLLLKLNHIAITLEESSPEQAAAVMTSPAESHRPIPLPPHDLVFFVAQRDTIWLRVQLAKHLVFTSVPDATMQAASTDMRQQRRTTTCVFLDTPDLAVYQARTLGASVEDVGDKEPAAQPPCGSTHLRQLGVDSVCLVHMPPGQATRTEVTLGRAEVTKLLKGDICEAEEGATSCVASALLAVRMAVQNDGLRVLAQASYNRSIYRDPRSSLDVTLDEDIKMAKLQDWEGMPSSNEFFPYSILQISMASGAQEACESPKWLRRIRDSAYVFQVSGFSKAAHAMAMFCAREVGHPLPHWYHSIVGSTAAPDGLLVPEEPPAAEATAPDDAAKVQPAATDEAQHTPSGSSTAPRVPDSKRQRGRTSSQLLHEFGRDPAEASVPNPLPPLASSGPPVVVAAADAGNLRTPLISQSQREGVDFEARSTKRSLLSRWRTLVSQTPQPAVAANVKPVRSAIVSVQPKTLFSLERTFLEWIHFAIMTAALGVAMMHGASSAAGSQLGRLVVGASIFQVLWALRTFSWRADALDDKEIRSYHDDVGPPLFVAILLVTLIGSSLHAADML